MDKSIYKQPWFLYIAECRDGRLYTGIARNAERRVAEHNKSGKCRYTRYRKPIVLKYKELCNDGALAEELEGRASARPRDIFMRPCRSMALDDLSRSQVIASSDSDEAIFVLRYRGSIKARLPRFARQDKTGTAKEV